MTAAAWRLLQQPAMDDDFIVEEESTSRKRPTAPTLTGWETVIFEVMDETEEMLANDVEALLVSRWF